MALRRTCQLRAARTNFQEFAHMPTKRDQDYIKPRTHRINSKADMFVGYQFPMSEFNWQRPRELSAGSASSLEWFSTKAMSRKAEKKSHYQNWYREALGTVQYMDGYDYPDLQNPDDLLPEADAAREVMGVIPLIASGRARAFAEAVEALRTNPERKKKDVEGLFAEYSIWSDPAVAGYKNEMDEEDVLRNQPSALYEVLLIMCAQHNDWVNVTALLREQGHRGVPLRSVVAAALFEYVTSAQMGFNLLEVLKKEGVKLHLHTYYALMRSLDRLEEEETALNLNAAWHENGEVSGDMLDFIVSGSQDSLFPDTNIVQNINGADPKEDVERAISDLLAQDRAVLHATPARAATATA